MGEVEHWGQTLALLLTDVVDSTKLSEQLGDQAMAAVWAAHDRVARDLLPVHNGREIDKTDGFLLLFGSAADAVAYATAYHRALRALDPPLQARAGLHVGPVILTENAPADVARGAKPLEVDGLAKPTAARIMSLALGGQTLLSEAAREALGATTLRVASHGHWRMKGVTEPVELFEIGVPGEAPFAPPPDGAKVWRVRLLNDAWVPVREVKRSLPAEQDAFVGRRSDLRELAHHLDAGARLVSVLGVGGTGKTRLVTRFAWTWLGEYPGGAWFCDLSEARSVEGIASAVATALDVPLGKDDPVVQLGHAIAGRGKCLVVLDNFEQVARHAPQTLGRWLARAPEAQFVVTTREVLGLPGENAFALAPLVDDEAVALFVARAQQAKRDFVLNDRGEVEALVKLLDGLPLAIELAAARVRLMAPGVVLQRMRERFKLLTSSGGRHTRQATLRATLDWSWELLSADEQRALGQLSVFEGGFTLEAAEAVLALSELWPTDAVQGLLDKSLVRRVSDDRLDLLVSVQEYASEKLDALGVRAEAEARHGAYFASLGTEEAVEALDRHGGTERWRRLSNELENLVAACRRAVARGDGAVAVATFRATWAVLHLRGPFVVAADLGAAVLGLTLSADGEACVCRACGNALRLLGRMDEARTRFEKALAVCRDAGDRRAEGHALNSLGNLHLEQGRMEEARALFERALAAYRDVGAYRSESTVLGNLGILHARQGRMNEARAVYEQALAVHRELGDRIAEGTLLSNLGTLLSNQGRMEEARPLYEQALAVHREVGNRRFEGIALGNLGVLQATQGRLDEARALHEQALAIHREVGDRPFEGTVYGNLGNLHLRQGRMEEARALHEQALAVHREVGNRRSEGVVLGYLGNLHLQQGRMDDARALFERALAVHRKGGDRLIEGHLLGEMGNLHLQQGRLDEAGSAFAEGERLLRQVGEGAPLAILLCGRARLEAAVGHLDDARRILAEAEALASELGAGSDSEVGKELAQARAAVEAR